MRDSLWDCWGVGGRDESRQGEWEGGGHAPAPPPLQGTPTNQTDGFKPVRTYVLTTGTTYNFRWVCCGAVPFLACSGI